jgi:hypothetical protein
MRRILFTLLLVAVPIICSAEIYKWVDEKGQTGFSDDLGKVPKKFRDKAVTTEQEQQAVEIVEKAAPEKGTKKGDDQPATADEKGKSKAKQQYGGKSGEAWKQDFARQKHEIKSLEEQAVGIKERMTDGSKMSRGEFLTLQSTARDLDVRIGKAKQKLETLNDAANKAEVPNEFRGQ